MTKNAAQCSILVIKKNSRKNAEFCGFQADFNLILEGGKERTDLFWGLSQCV